ncbi:MAG TPA: hypothetical protein DCP90_03155 [Clostridiales bacterium]|nr:MAG: hypothetical protein A2Y22_05950 [Clostridiales bacterium GWD2_32_59]HAN09593.1 hypothetical protein [Clostridiales bacterium]
MINQAELVSAIKGLMYTNIFSKEDTKERLVAILNYYRVINEVLCDMLEARMNLEKGIDCNKYLLATLFSWYTIFIKAYEFSLKTDDIAKLTKKKKTEIKKLINDCQSEDDLTLILEKLG